MAAHRERAQWEKALLEGGLEPSDVNKRRELLEGLYQAAENTVEALERGRTYVALLLEGVPPHEVEAKVDIDEFDPAECFKAFADEVSRSLEHLGLHSPKEPPPPPPKKAKGAERKRGR